MVRIASAVNVTASVAVSMTYIDQLFELVGDGVSRLLGLHLLRHHQLVLEEKQVAVLPLPAHLALPQLEIVLRDRDEITESCFVKRNTQRPTVPISKQTTKRKTIT